MGPPIPLTCNIRILPDEMALEDSTMSRDSSLALSSPYDPLDSDGTQ